MDVHIGEVKSTVRVTDEQTLLSPRVMEQIVRTVLGRLREEEERMRPLEEERQLRPAASARAMQYWTY
jgi:hypothetical protein